MDATTVRLILIVVGALLILLLYLWERHREKLEGHAHGADEEHDFEPDDELDARRYGDWGAKAQGKSSAADAGERRQPAWSAPSSTHVYSQSLYQSNADDDLDDDDATPAPAPARSTPKPEPLLVQVSVSARRHPFPGPLLLEVAETCGLHPGDMDIFHCLDKFEDETRVYFSMANMVKPGTFPFDDMDDFSTPGVLLFAQLEGDPEDMTILDEMIATARKLAMALNGDVLDDARRPLTVKKEEEMRQAVVANEMGWTKAMLR